MVFFSLGNFCEQAGTLVFGDILFVSSGGITFYEVWDPVIAGLSPADGTSSSSVTPVLSWDAVSGAGKYRLQGAVSLDTVASAPVEELTQPTYTWPTPLAAGETLYWRVKALDTAGAEGPWGSIASVKIE